MIIPLFVTIRTTWCSSFPLGHTDDDRYVETSIQIRQAQGTFPSAFGVAVHLLVEMLEDEDTVENGATGESDD